MSQHEPDLPGDYAVVLLGLKSLVRDAQYRAQQTVNTAMIELYWNIGKRILDRQSTEPWGSRVLDRLARDPNLRTQRANKGGSALQRGSILRTVPSL